MNTLAVIAIAAATFAFVLWPLRPGAPTPAPDDALRVERERIALAKDRKIDEIRELRGDQAAGKIEADRAREIERTLRAQAADLMHQLDELDERLGDPVA